MCSIDDFMPVAYILSLSTLQPFLFTVEFFGEIHSFMNCFFCYHQVHVFNQQNQAIVLYSQPF